MAEPFDLAACIWPEVESGRQPTSGTRLATGRRWALVNTHPGINLGEANAVGTLQGVGQYTVGKYGQAFGIPTNNVGALSYGANPALQLSILSGICVFERTSSAPTPLFTTSYQHHSNTYGGFYIQCNTSGAVEIDKHDIALILASSNTVAVGAAAAVAWSYNNVTGRVRIALNGILTSGTSAQTLVHSTVARGGHYTDIAAATNPSKQYLIAISPDEQTDAQLIYDSLYPWEIFEFGSTIFSVPTAGNISVTLTGLNNSSYIGNFTTSISKDATGLSQTFVNGALLAEASKTLSGSSITCSNGVLNVSSVLNLVGQSTGLTSGSLQLVIDKTITGTSITSSNGTLTISIGNDVVVNLAGMSVSVAYQTLIASLTKTLESNVVSCSNGTLVASTLITLLGQSTSFSSGSLDVVFDKTVSGIQVTITGGNVTAQVGNDITLALSGMSVTGAIGTLLPLLVTALSGNASASSLGALLPTISKDLSGVNTVLTYGSLQSDIAKALSGTSISSSYGTLTVAGVDNINVTLTGQTVSVLQGLILPILDKSLTGQAAVLDTTAFVAEISKVLTDMGLQSSIGNLGFSVTLSIAGQSVTVTRGTPYVGSNVFVEAEAIWQILIHHGTNNFVVTNK